MKVTSCDRCGVICDDNGSKENDDIKVICRSESKIRVNRTTTRQLDFCTKCKQSLKEWLYEFKPEDEVE